MLVVFPTKFWLTEQLQSAVTYDKVTHCHHICLVLSQNILRGESEKDFSGIKLARMALEISYLHFAVDSFFLKGTGDAARNLMRVLNDYFTASGQCLDKENSSMSLSPNTTLANARRCFKHLGGSNTIQLGTYLVSRK